MENNGSVDRFSGLPEAVIQDIISLLGFEDVACLGEVSRMYRKLCITCPYLNFDVFQSPEDSSADRHGVCKYLDKLLNKRGRTMIKRFRLNWRCLKRRNRLFDEQRLIDKWINKKALLRCNAEELVLDLDLCFSEEKEQRPFVLPVSRTLKVMKLVLNDGVLTLPPPNSDLLPSLEELRLEWVRFAEDSSVGEWISKSCKRLKTLLLFHFHGIRNLNIIHPCLETLSVTCLPDKICSLDELQRIHITGNSLKNVEMHWMFSNSANRYMRISAPNLQRFRWAGNTLKNYDLSFIALDRAIIFLDPPSTAPRDYNLDNLLLRINGANSLLLDILFIKMLFTRDRMYRTTSFGTLQKLDIKLISLEKDDLLLPAVASFLMRSPNLQTLSISYYDYEDNGSDLNASNLWLDKASWEPRNLLLPVRLKEVKMELKRGANELELMKYLLQHAEGLKNVTIYYSSRDYASLLQFHDKLQGLNIASFSPAIYYQAR